MTDWIVYVEEWLSGSCLVSTHDYNDLDFEIIGHESFDEVNDWKEEFDRIQNEDIMFGLSESDLGPRPEIEKENPDIIFYNTSPVVILESNAKKGLRKTRGDIEGNSTDYDSTVESENSIEEMIATDTNIKIISQLPTTNKKEDIKAIVHDDKSVTISCLNQEGKRSIRNYLIPHDINIETGR